MSAAESILVEILHSVLGLLIDYFGEEKAKTTLDDTFVQVVNASTRVQLDAKFGPKPQP